MLGSLIRALENAALRVLPKSLVCVFLRFALAVPFFKSGLTKWTGVGQLSESTMLLFTEEYRLHIFGKIYPYPFPTVIAYASGAAEILLPILLIFGLYTRLAAIGLLAMTAIIQLTFPDGWANYHLPWAALAMAIIVMGPGRLSLDGMLRRD